MATPNATELGMLQGKVTRNLTILTRRIAEQDQQEVTNQVKTVKECFKTFEKYHEKYHETLKKDESALAESLIYFEEIEKEYIDALFDASSFLASLKYEASAGASVSIQEKMIQMLDNQMNLPHFVLDVFTGDDVLEYPGWIASFDDNVDCKCLSNSVKMSRLMQFTGGKAKNSIKHCQTDNVNGYRNAREILRKRFGAPHLIMFRTQENLKTGPKIVSGEDLQQFSNDLDMAYSTVKKLNLDAELNTQSAIKEILNRCPGHLQNKYRSYSTDFIDKNSKYPGFKEFADFIRKWSRKMSDPVWSTSSFSETIPVGSTSCIFGSDPALPTDYYSASNYNASIPSLECHMCGDSHLMYQCASFRKLLPLERCNIVKNRGLCELCFSANHSTDECIREFRCTSPLASGLICNEKHSRLLHCNKTESVDNSFDNVASGSVFLIQGLKEVPLSSNESLDFDINPGVISPCSFASMNNPTNQTELADCCINALHNTNAFFEKRDDQSDNLFDAGIVYCNQLQESSTSDKYDRKCYAQTDSAAEIHFVRPVITACVSIFEIVVFMHFFSLIFSFVKSCLLGFCFIMFLYAHGNRCENAEYVMTESTHSKIVYLVKFDNNMLSFEWRCSVTLNLDFVT